MRSIQVLSKGFAVSLAVLATLPIATSARAQIMTEPPPAASTAPAPAAPAPNAPVAPPPPPGAAPAPAVAPAADEGETDHARVVGRAGITYFGISQLPIADQNGGAATINAPVLGVRYWLKDTLGIDAGLGFGSSSGSTTVAGASTSTPGLFGFALHGGVPLVVTSGKHYVFEVVPEATLGITTGSYNPPGAPNRSLSGLRFDIGARAGAEIHFGFIGIPQLAMLASIGVYLHDSQYSESPSGGSSTGQSQLTIATSVQNDPWSLFTDNISAIYYF